MFAMSHLALGQMLLLENKVTAAKEHFDPRCFIALTSALRILATNAEMLGQVEELLALAIEIAKQLQETVKIEREQFLSRQSNLRDSEIADDEGDNDDEDGEDEEDWTQQESVTLEINAGLVDASNALILLLIQLDRPKDAEPHLSALNYKYRLSSDVLAYKLPRKGPWRSDIPFVKAIDNALPKTALEYLQGAFDPTSVFWNEHFYCPDTPYFSYTHPLDNSIAPKSAMDQLIRYVHSLAVKLFPQVAEAKAAEWWTHCRTHNSGHQLHFDSAHEGQSDKKRKRIGPVHPIVSCVVYLSEGVGGPTMVTNQRLGDPLADRGWMVESAVNRLVVFDGSVLHGVIPGKGFHPEATTARRTSFMIAFWDHVDIKPSAENIPGSARPFPYNISPDIYTWPKLHTAKTPATWPGPVPEQVTYVTPTPLDRVWQSVPDSEIKPDSQVSNLQKTGIDLEVVEEHLELGYSKSELGLPNYNLVFQGF
ncbi:hypothetical protein BDR26DRAFT_880471 [Obelidium mucronatum]|nr:hypothetical protein BDR26DRAFT_880471 [Obelidium mucronatum]